MAEAPSTIRVGVWGLGRHARRRILPALVASDRTTLAGVTTRTRDVAAQEADRYGCAVWPTPADMLRDSHVDAVYVATPSGLHYDHGMMVLGAEKHLWCEKPLASRGSAAHKLCQTSRERELALCEGLMYLYHPHFLAIADLVRVGAIGDPLSLHSQFGLPPLENPGFRTNPGLGGGALLDLAPYPLSAAVQLLNQPLNLVECDVGRGARHTVDVSGFALFRTVDRGATAFLEWGYERAYRNHISIWGELGSLHADFVFSKSPEHVPEISLLDRHGGAKSIAIDPADSFGAMFAAFADAVGSPALQEDLRTQIEIQAAYLEDLGRSR